jgi:hypothetical protein
MKRSTHSISLLTVAIVLGIGACGSGVDLDAEPGPDGPVGPQGEVGPQGDIGPEGSLDVVSGSGTMAIEPREVGSFERIEFRSEGHVIVTLGEPCSVAIETDDNLLSHLDADVRGGTLDLRTVGDSIDIEPTDSVTWHIDMPAIEEIRLIGAGSIDVNDADGARLVATIDGVGDVNLIGLSVGHLSATINGVGTIRATGHASSVDLSVDGPGTIDAGDLEVATASCAINSAGEIVVWATDELDVAGTGIGTVSLYGSPHLSGHTAKVNALGER